MLISAITTSSEVAILVVSLLSSGRIFANAALVTTTVPVVAVVVAVRVAVAAVVAAAAVVGVVAIEYWF